MNAARSGLVLFAHGARDPAWRNPFDDVARRVSAMRPALAVRLAFLEFTAPSLAEAVDELAADGCDEVVVLPMFLGTGGHVRRDLPAIVDAVRSRHPRVAVRVAPAVGEQEGVLAAMAEAAVASARPLTAAGDAE